MCSSHHSHGVRRSGGRQACCQMFESDSTPDGRRQRKLLEGFVTVLPCMQHPQNLGDAIRAETKVDRVLTLGVQALAQTWPDKIHSSGLQWLRGDILKQSKELPNVSFTLPITPGLPGVTRYADEILIGKPS